MREAALRCKKPEWTVRGYRGGYLPNERRAIERGIREGNIRTVVSTNALELGIDIGGLEASVWLATPAPSPAVGSRWGRAVGDEGSRWRSLSPVATPGPVHRRTPDYFFDQSPESGLVNPTTCW